MRKALLLCCLLIVGCSINETSQSAFTGGIVGTGVGAGVGALIADSIDKSAGTAAAIGAGVGLAAGAAVGAVYRSAQQSIELGQNQAQIEDNVRDIYNSNVAMEQIRQDLKGDSFRMDPDPADREYLYMGPTLGSPTR